MWNSTCAECALFQTVRYMPCTLGAANKIEAKPPSPSPVAYVHNPFHSQPIAHNAERGASCVAAGENNSPRAARFQSGCVSVYLVYRLIMCIQLVCARLIVMLTGREGAGSEV